MSHHRSAVRRLLSRSGSFAAAMGIVLAFSATSVFAAAPPKVEVLDAQGIVHVHGAGKPARNSNPNLLYHGGAIMTSSTIQAIFWGGSWSSAAAAGDKITGLDRFYGGVGGTSYLKTNTEYTGTNNTVVGTGVTYQGHVFDASAAPGGAPKTAAVLAVVARSITNPVPNGYYPVYSDQKRGHAGYCAWHSYGTVNGVPVQFAFFFNLDGDASCDPADPGTIHSQGLEAVANVSGHELSEAVTDPRNGGWWDASGAENSDKCAWTFGGNVSIGGQSWKIQGNWSNAAYTARSGYDGAGCIQTK